MLHKAGPSPRGPSGPFPGFEQECAGGHHEANAAHGLSRRQPGTAVGCLPDIPPPVVHAGGRPSLVI